MIERLKQIRKHDKLSQTAFGERLGVSRSVINNIEQGAVEISDVMIKAICAEFNVDERWLRTGEGTMFKNTDMQAIENLSKTHDLDELDRKILHEYITLPPEMRAAFKKYLLNLANSISVAEEPKTPEVEVIVDGKKVTNPEAVQEIKTIIWEMEEEKKATEKLSDSHLGKDA